MIRLLLKIFLAYWVVAGIVIVISDFEPHRHIHNPELTDALDSALAMDGRDIVNAFEDGHCQEFQKLHSVSHDVLSLTTTEGQLLCGGSVLPDLSKLVAAAVKQEKRVTANYAEFQMLAVPVTSSSTGARYVLLLKSNYHNAAQYYGLLPGYTTVSISCAVTVFLGVLIALPIRRLRQAAGQIAMGRLDARVHWGMSSAKGLPSQRRR